MNNLSINIKKQKQMITRYDGQDNADQPCDFWRKNPLVQIYHDADDDDAVTMWCIIRKGKSLD